MAFASVQAMTTGGTRQTQFPGSRKEDMKTGRSQIIWFGQDGTGKVMHLTFDPALFRLLVFLLVLCVGAIPFLESGLLSLAHRVGELEKKKLDLQAEVGELRFLKKTLAAMEKKDRMLRTHFGMEAFDSLSMMALGGGGPGSSSGPRGGG